MLTEKLNAMIGIEYTGNNWELWNIFNASWNMTWSSSVKWLVQNGPWQIIDI